MSSNTFDARNKQVRVRTHSVKGVSLALNDTPNNTHQPVLAYQKQRHGMTYFQNTRTRKDTKTVQGDVIEWSKPLTVRILIGACLWFFFFTLKWKSRGIPTGLQGVSEQDFITGQIEVKMGVHSAQKTTKMKMLNKLKTEKQISDIWLQSAHLALRSTLSTSVEDKNNDEWLNMRQRQCVSRPSMRECVPHPGMSTWSKIPPNCCAFFQVSFPNHTHPL